MVLLVDSGCRDLTVWMHRLFWASTARICPKTLFLLDAAQIEALYSGMELYTAVMIRVKSCRIMGLSLTQSCFSLDGWTQKLPSSVIHLSSDSLSPTELIISGPKHQNDLSLRSVRNQTCEEF